MRQVINEQTFKQEAPINVTECHVAELYFMAHQGMVFHLHRYRLAADTASWEYIWCASPGVTTGDKMRDLKDALQYALSIGARVYQFKDWKEVIPHLL